MIDKSSTLLLSDPPQEASREQQAVSKLYVSQVCKNFQLKGHKTLCAVSSVSFEVQQSEICILLGPSGCGKSTILRMVAGLESISAGRILLDRQPITGPGRDRGMVFQSYTSFPWLTVKQNVEYGLRVNGHSRAERQDITNHFIDRVRLTPFKDAYPDQLSGGMRQRVAIARALANGPEILLMDEPFGALDPETRWQMQELLLDIVRMENMTVLMVTHDVDEALFLADKILFLSSHPGTVRERIPAPLQNSAKPTTKESMYEIPEYINLQKRIMHLMREVTYDPTS